MKAMMQQLQQLLDRQGASPSNTLQAGELAIQADKTHPSYHEACAYARELGDRVGNTNGQ
jgi:hypothetical protein